MGRKTGHAGVQPDKGCSLSGTPRRAGRNFRISNQSRSCDHFMYCVCSLKSQSKPDLTGANKNKENRSIRSNSILIEE